MHVLGSGARLISIPLRRFSQFADNQAEIVIFDLAGFSEEDLDIIASWRMSAAGMAAAIVLVADNAMRARLIELGLHRDTNVIKWPLDMAGLPALITYIEGRALNNKTTQLHLRKSPRHRNALLESDAIFDSIFRRGASAARLDLADLEKRSEIIIGSIGEAGLAGWVEAARVHHNPTYQHCLLVTGTLLAFGHHHRMGSRDLKRLALAGMLHDIGKVEVPVAILDKPADLTPEEMTIMRLHPAAGARRLKQVYGITEEIQTFTRDHHEYLDGSGYPNGLMAGSISDPLRLLTIADTFAMLIERRPSRETMSPINALQVMEAMEGKLDLQLLASVVPVLKTVRH